MRAIGIFEAKAKLSEICEAVARSGESIVITRRGVPLVRIDPIAADRFSVWEDRASYVTRNGPFEEEFDLPPRSGEMPVSPLED